MDLLRQREAQVALAKHFQQCFRQMKLGQIERANQEKQGSRDEAWCKGAWVAFAMAENACECFISGAEAEEAGLGVLDWTPTGFRLRTNKKGE